MSLKEWQRLLHFLFARFECTAHNTVVGWRERCFEACLPCCKSGLGLNSWGQYRQFIGWVDLHLWILLSQTAHAVDKFLTHADRRDKCTRIMAYYVNNQVDVGALDPWVSFSSLIKDTLHGARFLQRQLHGAQWVNSFDTMKRCFADSKAKLLKGW